MPVTGQQMATLRAQLAGDVETHRRLLGQLDRSRDGLGYSALTMAAFFEAVERRFAKNASSADVIEFVGEVRARSPRAAEQVDPRVGERLIRAVYTDEEIDDLDSKTETAARLILLAALIADEQLDDDDLDEFMADARKLADEWLD